MNIDQLEFERMLDLLSVVQYKNLSKDELAKLSYLCHKATCRCQRELVFRATCKKR